MAEPIISDREWILSEAGRSGANYYKLLGLDRLESDPQKIATAADAMVAFVRRMESPATAEATRGLLETLAVARRTLLDPQSKAEYDATLRKPSATPAVGIPTAVPVTAPLDSSLWEDKAEIPRVLRSAVPRSQQNLPLLVIVGLLLILSLVAIGIYWFWQNSTTIAPPAQRQTVSATETLSYDKSLPVERTSPSDPPSLPGEPQVTTGTTAEPADQRETSSVRELPPAVEDAAHWASSSVQDASPASNAVTYARAINHARGAIVARDLAQTKRQLALAEQSAESQAQESEIRQFRALVAQLDLFWEAVRRGLAKLEPTEELHIGEAVAAVVEVGPENLSLFVEGSRRDYTLATMPTKVALWIAGTSVDENSPHAELFLGAFHAADPKGDRRQARQLWDSARAAGQSTEELSPFLNCAALTIVREPIPETQNLADAGQYVERQFSAPLRAAITAERKSALASTLITASRESELSSEQYALLKEACRLATSAAAATPALEASRELAKWFDVDALALQSEALEQAIAASSTTASAKQIARAALDLWKLADQAHRVDQTQALAIIAQMAARKSRDPDLIKRAKLVTDRDSSPNKKSAKAATGRS